ncbi:hypothetical protein [Pseudoteredinibacter isoporae]|uniref:Uncharacterized protein n=1 Tax=Pseudoteredinibacter isoporae TaxID=570281 RepID=A0A7X0JUJ6_9GAMM|nr:hypothetical protein [Pseudoteredinibacter isoporae]MBB6521651.1 hypothetical protein [Pseudoteredinibacter isoporae]
MCNLSFNCHIAADIQAIGKIMQDYLEELLEYLLGDEYEDDEVDDFCEF